MDANPCTAQSILLHPGKKLRQGEPDAVRDYFAKIGIPVLGEITGSGLVEGGDVVWMDERTIAVARGYRTNDEGIRAVHDYSFI